MRLPVNQEGFSDKLRDYRDWRCERTGRSEAAASSLMYVRDQIMRVAGHDTTRHDTTRHDTARHVSQVSTRVFDDIGKIASIGTAE